MERNCLFCKEEFNASNSKRMFCSRDCKVKANVKPSSIYEIVCLECQTEFNTHYEHQRYCSDKCREKYWGKKSYKNNREKRLEYASSEENKARQRELAKKPERRKKRNEYLRNKRKTDHVYRLKHLIWGRIRTDDSIKGRSKIANLEIYLGYTIVELWEYLKVRIPDGYSDRDYLNGILELDHIIPYSWYLLEEPGDEEFKKCWSFKNLRLLFKDKNRSRKRASFDWDMIKDGELFDILPLGPMDVYSKKFV
jgi:hypothetical protein